MARYSFSPEEFQRRAALASDLKKKYHAQRQAAEGEAGPAKAAGAEKKKVKVEAPRIDYAAIRRDRMDRRLFLAGTGAFCAAIGITLGGSTRFMFPRILFEPPSMFDAGRPEDFLADQPRFFKEFKTWIIRTGGRIYALSGRCTHLGCTPKWLASDVKFKCPCHGSGFRMTGVNFEGPAPRALERFQIQLVGGKIIVEKSKMFLYEKAEWDAPDSYLIV